jgi:hypothetical protein
MDIWVGNAGSMIYVGEVPKMRKEEKKIWDSYLTKFSAKMEGGLLKNLREEVNIRSDIVEKHYMKLMEAIGVKGEDIRCTLMNTFAYSVFDKYNWKLRDKGESPAKEYRRFKKTITRIEDYLDEDLLYYAIKDECNELSNLNRAEIERIITSMSQLANSIKDIKNIELINFANELKNYITFNTSKYIPEKIYRVKSQYYGALLMMNVKDNATAIEALKTIILCLPIGEQQIANMYTYLLTVILSIWNIAGRSNIYAPLDHGVAEVLLSLGLTDKRIENMEYESSGYKAYKIICDTLFPEDPSKMMVARAVAERWCYQRKIKICDECWLNKLCPKEY